MDGAISTMDAGAPDLPVIVKMFQIPAARARVRILQVDEEPVAAGDIVRIPENTRLHADNPNSVGSEYESDVGAFDQTPLQTEGGAPAPSDQVRIPDRSDIYRNAGNGITFPNQWVTVEPIGMWRGHRMGILKMFPLRINPMTGQAIWVKRAVLRVSFEGARPYPIDPRPLTRTEQTSLQSMLGPLGSTIFAREKSPNLGAFNKTPLQTPLQTQGGALAQGGTPVPQHQADFIPGIVQYKIYLSQEGLYHITYQDLVNAGIQVVGITPQNLRLRNKGQDIPIYVSGETDGRFDPEDYIEFYGYPNQKTFIDQYYHDMYRDPFSDVNVYWLSWSPVGALYSTPPLRIIEESRPPSVPEDSIGLLCHVPYNFLSTVHQESDANFQRLSASALNTMQDHWFMDNGITGLQSRTYLVNLPYPDSIAIDSANIRIALTGLTFGEGGHLGTHHAMVWLNDQSTPALAIGADSLPPFPWSWLGQSPVVADTRLIPGGGIPQRTVSHGLNEVRIGCLGDTPDGANDVILANWFDIIYPRLLRAYQNQLKFNAPAGRPAGLYFPDHLSPQGYPLDTLYHFSIDNFTTNDISLYKFRRFVGAFDQTPSLPLSVISNFNVQWVENPDARINSFVLTFQDVVTEPVDYLALTQNKKLSPDSIRICTSTGRLSSPTQTGANYLVIAHPIFMQNQYLDSLLALRSNDYSTLLVSTEEIYDEFSNGIITPFALKDFLDYAYQSWSIPPEMVLLIGDLVYDMKNYTRYGGCWVPSLYVNGYSSGWYPSDFSFSLVSGDDYIPDLAIGRIPCRSQNELNRVIQKILTYSRASRWGPWRNSFLFISSKTWSAENDFVVATRQILGSLPDHIMPQILEEDSGRVYSGGQIQLRNLFNQQANANVVTIYNGHGAGGTWSGTLWLTNNIASMNNALNLPFITNFTCYICAFDTRESPMDEELMGKEFLQHQNSGAIAVYGSVSLGWFLTGINYQLIAIPIMGQIPGLRLGDVVNQSKALFSAGVVPPPGPGLPPSGDLTVYTTLQQMVLLGDPAVQLLLPQQEISAPLGVEFSPDPFVSPGDTVTMTITPPCTSGVADFRMFSHYPSLRGELSPYPTQFDSLITALDTTELFPWDRHMSFSSSPFSVNIVIPDTCFTFLDSLQGFPRDIANVGSVRGYLYNTALAVDAASHLEFYRNEAFLDTVEISNITTIPDSLLPNQVWRFRVRVFTRLGVDSVITIYTLRNGNDSLIAEGSLPMSEVPSEQFYWETASGVGPYPAYPVYPQNLQWALTYQMAAYTSDSLETVSSVYTKLVMDDRPNLAITRQALSLGGIRVSTVLDTISNTGMSAVDSVVVRYQLTGPSGFMSKELVLRNIPANSTVPISFPQSFKPGFHTGTINIDPPDLNWVNETDELDNGGLIGFTVDHFQVTRESGIVFPDSAGTKTIEFDSSNFDIRIAPLGIAQDSAVIVIRKVDSVSVAGQGDIASIPEWNWGYEVLFGDSSVQLSAGAPPSQDTLSAWVMLRSGTLHIPDSLWQEIAPYSHLPYNNYWSRVEHDSLIGITPTVRWVKGDITHLGVFAAMMSVDTCGVNCGPQITVSVEGQLFGEGSYIPTHPKITAFLQDYSGIDRTYGRFWAAYGDAGASPIPDSTVLQTDEVVWTDTLQVGGAAGATISPVFTQGPHWVAFFATDNNGNPSYRRYNFQVAGRFELLYVGNYPNPFRTRTIIAYTLTDQADERVRMRIYTVSGRLIRTMFDPNPHPVNYREVIWDGKDDNGNDIANGVYFCRLRAVQGEQTIEKTIKIAKIR